MKKNKQTILKRYLMHDELKRITSIGNYTSISQQSCYLYFKWQSLIIIVHSLQMLKITSLKFLSLLRTKAIAQKDDGNHKHSTSGTKLVGLIKDLYKKQ